MTAELRGAIGSASVQQLYTKCHLIVWAGGRVSLQSLWWGTERSGVTVTNWQGFGGWGGVVLRADHVLWPFWSRTILCAILKDLPPTQRCLGSVYFDVSAIGSASVQQLYTKCHLIVWAGGRVSLQSL